MPLYISIPPPSKFREAGGETKRHSPRQEENRCCRNQKTVKDEVGLSGTSPSSHVLRSVYVSLQKMRSPWADGTDSQTIPEKLS